MFSCVIIFYTALILYLTGSMKFNIGEVVLGKFGSYKPWPACCIGSGHEWRTCQGPTEIRPGHGQIFLNKRLPPSEPQRNPLVRLNTWVQIGRNPKRSLRWSRTVSHVTTEQLVNNWEPKSSSRSMHIRRNTPRQFRNSFWSDCPTQPANHHCNSTIHWKGNHNFEAYVWTTSCWITHWII